MEDPTKYFEPKQVITLYDKTKQKYAIGALLINSPKIQDQKEEALQEDIEEKFEKIFEEQQNYPDPQKEISLPQLLIIFITQLVKIYFLFIHKLTWSTINLLKQKIQSFQL